MRLSLGELIDKLGIVNIKCFMQIDFAADKNRSDAERLAAHDNVRKLNSDRNNLIRAINEEVDRLAAEGPLKHQLSNLKMYKDGLQG